MLSDALDETHDALMLVEHVIDGLPGVRYAMTDPERREQVRAAEDDAAAAWRHLRRVVVALNDPPCRLRLAGDPL